MAFDFPNSPGVGQQYSPGAGQPVYTWDGEKWAVATVGQITGAVRYDAAQALTAAQQQQGRQNIYAPPFEAMADRNLIINGAMEVSQENGNTGITLVNGVPRYIVDGWSCVMLSATGAAYGVQGSGTSPVGNAFVSCLAIGATIALGAPAAGDAIYFNQQIEGLRVVRASFGHASAQPVTLFFWIYASVSGVASIAIGNNAANRSYVSNFTINTPGTWEFKAITIPGDIIGTWAKDTGIGFRTYICFEVGTTLQAPNNTWSAGNFLGTSSNTRFFSGANNQVLLTGVGMVIGNEAPSAARSALMMRTYEQEIRICKRYWQKMGGGGPASIYITGYQIAGGLATLTYPYPVAMRTTPTGAVVGVWTNTNCNGPILSSLNVETGIVYIVANIAGLFATYGTDTSCFVSLDARL